MADSVERVLFGWWTKFYRAPMCFARADVRGPHRFTQQRPGTSYRRYDASYNNGSAKFCSIGWAEPGR